MRQRSCHAEHGSSLHHEQQHEKSEALFSRRRKKQRLRKHRDWTLLYICTCFVLICIVTFLSIHSTRPRIVSTNGNHFRQNPIGSILNDRNGTRSDKNINEKLLQTANTQKCPFYGCEINGFEVSQLDNTSSTEAISPSHLILTHKSNRKVPAPVNQDRSILISPFLQSQNNFLMGIFDGHDNLGHEVAELAMKGITRLIAARLKEAMGSIPLSNTTIDQNVVVEAIIHAHEDFDKSLPYEKSMMGGCTAHMILRLGSNLYMSNLGDSYSYLVTYASPFNGIQKKHIVDDLQPHLKGRITIHHENMRHKPHLPDENSRIKALGGRIHIPSHPMGSRVIVKSSAHNEDVGLAMSRSIGDFEWTKVGVIPTPDVHVVNLAEIFADSGDQKLFAVVASDGLFDHRQKDFVTKHIARVLYETSSADAMNSNTKQTEMFEGVKKLITATSPLKPEWYRDDISIVVKNIE